MAKPLPYRSLPADPATLPPGFDVLVLGAALTATPLPLLTDTAPVVDAGDLAYLHLTLELEAAVAGPAPALSVTLGPLQHSFDLTGLERLAASYRITAEGGLLPLSGGGIAPAGTGWAVVAPGSVGAFPESGVIALRMHASGTDVGLNFVRLVGRWREG